MWTGFKIDEFMFEGKKATVICPKEPDKNGRWLMKTEWFTAFQNAEKALVEKGFHLTFLENTYRWCPEEDYHRRARFQEYVVEKYGLSKKCALVGMSAGGASSCIYAGMYPENVSALYLDAPVMNFLSCPMGLGNAHCTTQEQFHKYTGLSLIDLLNYRQHPIDQKEILLKHNMPIILVCGDSDEVVPYEENGKYLYDYYTENGGKIELILKPGCGHHPHGLDDPTPIVEFIEQYSN